MLRLSLTKKMSVVVSLLLTAVLCVMTLGVTRYLEQQYRITISRQQFSMASAMAAEIDGKIESMQAQITALASMITPAMVANRELAQKFLEGQPDVRVTFDNAVALYAADGRLMGVNPLESSLVGKDYAFREYFKQPLATRRPYLSEPFVSTQSHRHPVVILTVPVLDRHGQVIGVLGGSLDLLKDNFLGRMARTELGKAGYMYLFDRDGTVVVHTDPQKIMKRRSRPGKNPLFEKALLGFEGTGETVNSRGVRLLTSFKALRCGWVLAVNYPQSEAYAQLDRAKWYLLEAFLAALCLSIGVTWFSMRRLTAPLRSFIRHLEGLSGRDPEPITVKSGDEIELLAQSFNRMVDEVQRQKEAAQAQKGFTESLIQNSSVPTFVLDREHRVIIWNHACEELTGVPASSLIGTDYHWRVFYDEKRPTLADHVLDGRSEEELARIYGGEVGRTTSGVHAEGWYRGLNGRDRFLCFDAATILDAQGELVAVVETLRDLTERKQGEEDLRQATAAAEAANVAKTDFLANMSHEIRTPMNYSIGMLYLLQQTHLTDSQKEYLAKAQNASNQLLKVITDILDYSKMEAGRLEMQSVPFRLSAVLGDLSPLASVGLQDKSIQFVVSVDPSIPDQLVGDASRLGQVLGNLTNNAFKFTYSGKVEVSVSPVSTTASQVELSFSVRDTGIGIAPEEQSRLFSAFSQGDSHTTRRFGGTGLGLAISKSLVELMGGRIWMESEKGKGSCFTFQVPLQIRPAEEISRVEMPAPLAEIPDGKLRGAHILVVDDHFFDQEFAREVLEQRGVIVDLARDGAEALAKVTASGAVYDAVLMDVQMPVMDGLEATRRIRRNHAYRNLPIIAMTGSPLTRERQLSLQAGMNDQVNKPIDLDDLFGTLDRWLGERQTVEEPAESAADGYPRLPDLLPGIDVKRALKTLEWEPLLLKLLLSFRQENKETLDNLRDALDADERQVARRIVHTVKGVSANLGALELSAAALTLERAISEREVPGELLADFEQKMLQVLDSIASLQREVDEQAPLGESVSEGLLGDREKIAPIFKKLHGLLEADNLKALEVWEEMKPHLAGPAADRLGAALSSLDFRAGSRLLVELAANIEIAL